MAERKKLKQDPPATTVDHTSTGAVLRAAREQRGMEIDEVSQAIHIRPVQLKALEENDIDALPGMTYAVGFVRSYANFLGLNGAEVVHRFKAEQGRSPEPSKLNFPEPIAESRVPDPMMVGIGAMLAVVILVVWTIYSNVHGSSKAADQIPPAPEVTASAEMPSSAASSTTAPSSTLPGTPAAQTLAETPVPAASTPVSTPDSSNATPAASSAAPPADSTLMTPAPAPAADASAPKPDAAPVAKDEHAAPAITAAASDDDAKAAAASEGKKDDKKDSVIKIKKDKTRITLKATLPTWVQVTDPHQGVLYRKVLRPGEQYAVPDQPDLTLDTANAGGLDVIVDGKQVQAIGERGEILRGISLNPAELKIKKTRVRN